MFRSLRDWIARIISFVIPAFLFALVYAFLIRAFYLDPSGYQKLLLANRPLRSYFAWVPKEKLVPTRTLAFLKHASPGETVQGAPATETPRDGEFPQIVPPPAGSFEAALARTKNVCASVERIEHRGPAGSMTASDRELLIEMFNRSKQQLFGWLYSQKERLGDGLVEWMQSRVAQTGMKLPPVDFEPDLVYRGIVVSTRDAAGAPTLAIGSRFPALVRTQPARAQFEMTRALAQAWAPCDTEAKTGAGNHPWKDLLNCFGVKDEGACAAGGFSEGGWVVSSTLATYVSAPGCKLAAFADAAVVKCLAQVVVARGARVPAAEGAKP